MTDTVQQLREVVRDLQRSYDELVERIGSDYSASNENLLRDINSALFNAPDLIAQVEAMQKALTEPPTDEMIEAVAKAIHMSEYPEWPSPSCTQCETAARSAIRSFQKEAVK